MNNLFLLFLSLSLSGSILALLLFAIQPLVGKRLSKSWQYYIWLVVLLRFLLPFAPQFSAVGELTRSIQTAVTVESADVLPPIEPGTGNANTTIDDSQIVNRMEQASRTGALPQAQVEIPMGKWTALFAHGWVIWLGVTLVLMAYKVATYRSFARFARAGAIEVFHGRLYNLYLDELAIGNIRRRLPLYVNDLISSPMLVGLFRPIIILPTLNVNDDELRYILRHEITHYKRLDGQYKWLAQLVLSLHWFNPMVYLVVRQLGKACELACDEAVVKRMDVGNRMGYGDALIASLKAQGSYNSSVISITMSEDASAIKERLDAIASYKGKTIWRRVASTALTVLFFCGFAFTGAYRVAGQGDRYAGTTGGIAGIAGNPPDITPQITSRTPEHVDIITARAGGPVVSDANVEIVIVDSAAVTLVPTLSDELSVDYDDSLYAASIEQKNGSWRIRISYTGSDAAYPAATLHLPDAVYGNVDVYAEEATVYFDGVFRQGGTVNTHLENCSVFYTIPAGFEGIVNAITSGSYFQLDSEDGYQNCDIAIANCVTFGNIADGFSQQGGSLVYSHGTGLGVVRVDMQNEGYATIESGYHDSPVSNAIATDGLKLVEREYTVAQLREANIWGVKVAVASEQVTVATGGQTLKLQYYQKGSNDYTLETVSDRGGTIEELYLLRNADTLDSTPRAIHIIIPDGFDCDVLHITTANGSITINESHADTVLLQTQDGRIWLNGGGVESYFSATSAVGRIDITGTSLPGGEFSNNLQTESGTVRLHLPLPSSEYTFKLDVGNGARIQIGGEQYSAGSAYTVNNGASAGAIRFTSESGVLVVEDV